MMAQLPPGVGEELPPGVGPALPEAGPLAAPPQASLFSPLRAAFRAAGTAASLPFQAAGKLDVASGIKTPEQAASRAQTYGNVTRDMLIGALTPFSAAAGWGGLGKNMLQSGALSGATTALETGDMEQASKSAALGAGLVPAFRGVLAPFRLRANAKAFQRAGDEREATVALNKFKADTLDTEDLTRFKQAVKAYGLPQGDQVAADLVKRWKARVPAWKDTPETLEGLKDLVVGQGHAKASASFDAALKNAMAAAKGQSVSIDRRAAEALGIPLPPLERMPPELYGLMAKAGMAPPRVEQFVAVDASDAMQRMLGKSSTARQAYRHVAEQLDKVNLGNAGAREEYKSAMGLIDLLDDAKALRRYEGKDVLDTEKLRAALLRVKGVSPLRRRGLGDALRGDVAETLQQARAPYPQAPTPRQTPVVPTLEEQGFKQQDSLWSRLAGGAVGYGLGGAMGHPWYGAHVGTGVGKSLGPGLVTRARLSPQLTELFTRYPSLLATLSRSAVMSPGPVPSQGE